MVSRLNRQSPNRHKTRRARAGALACASLIGLGAIASTARAEEESSTQGTMVSTEALVGQRVETSLGHHNATVKELMIDPTSGRIALVIVSLGDENGSTLAAPWRALRRDGDGSLRIAVESNATAAPPARPRTGPGAPESARPEAAEASPDASSEASAAELKSYVPNEGSSARARYDADRVREFEGIVVGSVVAPFGSSSKEVVLLVDDGGQEVRAHLGPQSYLNGLGTEIEPGVHVSFTGSEVSVDGAPVVLVSELTVGRRKIVLRRQDGAPVW